MGDSNDAKSGMISKWIAQKRNKKIRIQRNKKGALSQQ
jgi:hypothetical protein